MAMPVSLRVWTLNVRVNTDAICAAILDIFEDTRTMAEPAGALAVAGMKQHLEAKGGSDGAQIAIVSGANINFHRLRHIPQRILRPLRVARLHQREYCPAVMA